MKEFSLEYLRCVNCNSKLELEVFERTNEVKEGFLLCLNCSSRYPIISKIPILWSDFASYLSNRAQLGGYLMNQAKNLELKSFVKSSLKKINRKTTDVTPIEKRWVTTYKDSLKSKFYNHVKNSIKRLPKSDLVLEHGCSIGYLTRYLALKHDTVFGIDQSFFAIAEAKKNSVKNLDYFVAKTVKTDTTIAGLAGYVDFDTTSHAGEYVLAFSTGCSGGGAGGLVQPGLVLNFLAATLAGAGGKDTTPPSLTRPISSGVQFDPFTPIESELTGPAGITQQAPLRINGNNYPLYGYSNTIVKNTVETGQFTDMSLVFEEASKVEHVAMYFVDQGNDEYSDTDPALIFDKGNIAKADPEGIFGDDIQLSTSKEGTKSIFNFGVSFDKPTNKNLMIVAWDDKRNSGVTKIFNAIEVVGNAIPNEVAHFMPIEALGEFDLVKNDNGQYVLSQPVATETVISDSPKSTVYPEFIGRLERHDLGQLYDAISYEQQKASDLMVGKFNLDTSHRFVVDDEVKPYDMSRRASELTMCYNKIGCGFDRENNELIQKLLWQEHLKAEKMLKSLLVGSKYNQD